MSDKKWTPHDTKTRKPRSFKIEKVDLGDGKPTTVWLIVDREGIGIRKHYGRKAWWLPLVEAAGMIARQGQVRSMRLQMGQPLRWEKEG